MSQERHTVIKVTRQAGGGPAFDGTTLCPFPTEPGGAGWAPPGPANTKTTYFESALPVGRFRPLILGRTRNKHSRYRIYCDGPLTPGDSVFVRGSLNTNPSDHVVPPNPLRTAPIPLTTSLALATPFELGPFDDPCVVHQGNGDATIHLVGYDLDEAQLDRQDQAFMLAQQIGGQVAGAGGPVTTVTVTSSQTLDPWVGTLVVFVNMLAAGEVLELPAFASVPPPGPNGPIHRALIIRIGGNVPVIQAQPGESINGQVSPTWAFEMEGFMQLEVLRLFTDWGAQHPLTTVSSNRVITNPGDSVILPVPFSNVETVTVTALADGEAVLPIESFWPLNSEMFLMRTPGTDGQIMIRPQVGALLNSELNGRAYIGPNQVGRIRRTMAGYIVTDDGSCRESLWSQSGLAVVTLEPWGLHERQLTLTALGAQTVQLPALARMATGAALLVHSVTIAKTLQAALGEVIFGGGAPGANTKPTIAATVNRIVASDKAGASWLLM